MPFCPFGAEPSPLNKGLQDFADAADIPLAIIGLGLPSLKIGAVALGAALIDYDTLCGENPQLPEPITLEDELAQWQWGLTGTLTGEPRVFKKVWQWIRYERAGLVCVCKLPPLTPGENCIIPMPAPVSFPPGGTLEFTVPVDPNIVSTWSLNASAHWVFQRQGQFSCEVGGAGNCLLMDLEVELDGIWFHADDLTELTDNPNTCFPQVSAVALPRVPSSPVHLRIHNRDGFAHTAQLQAWCFCLTSVSPTPPPVQPVIVNLPEPPTLACSTNDLCVMINELTKRIGTIALQVSDIQASIAGFDQLTELTRLTMVPEGEAILAVGTRAVSVELTALGPEAFTSALGRPRGLMRVGSVRWGDGIGYSPRTFLDGDRFTWTRPPGATSISWQLLAGTEGILKLLG